MITYSGTEVRIIGGDKRLREATVEWASGKVRVIGLHQLKGTRGGSMEVLVTWEQACKRSKALEREAMPKPFYGAPKVGKAKGPVPPLLDVEGG